MVRFFVILAAIAVLILFIFREFNPLDQFKKINDNKRKEDILKIQNALETYYQKNLKYPSNPSSTDYRIKGFRLDHPIIDWGEEWKPYLEILPKDPNYPSKMYIYFSTSDGQTYYLYASLDMGEKDKDACNKGEVCESIFFNNLLPDACGGVCNYGVSSKNVKP